VRKMRRTTLFSVVVALMLAALLPASTASATTTRIPQTGSEICGPPISPFTFWVSDGVQHVRGMVLECEATGDDYLAGDEVVVVNLNQDLATGGGTLWGTWRSDLVGSEGGFEGTWNGHYTPTTPDGWLGRAVGQGWGELEGWQARLVLRTTHNSVSGFVFSGR